MEEFHEQIKRASEIAKKVNEAIQPVARKVAAHIKPFMDTMEIVSKSYAPVIGRLNSIAIEVAKKARIWQERVTAGSSRLRPPEPVTYVASLRSQNRLRHESRPGSAAIGRFNKHQT